MQAVLVMFRSDGERRSFSIARDMTVVGRREDCDLRIPLGEVSRKHCRLVRDGDVLKLEDLGSSNGTFLNARRVQEALLSPGDSIQVGPVVFVLQVDGEPADEDLQPVEAQPIGAGASVDEDAEPLSPLNPTATSEAGEVEELEPLEELEEDAPAPAARRPAPQPPGSSDELEELEPIESLDDADHAFDVTSEQNPGGTGAELEIDLDAEENRR